MKQEGWEAIEVHCAQKLLRKYRCYVTPWKLLAWFTLTLRHVSQNKSIMEDLDTGQLRELTFWGKKCIWKRAFLSEFVYVTLHCKVFNPLMHVNNRPFLNIHGMMLHPNHVWQPLTLSHNYTCLSIVLFITTYNSIIQYDWQKKHSPHDIFQ